MSGPVEPRTGRNNLKPEERRSIWLCWLIPLTGLFAVVWFLVRVIPKPSRATYPCQRIAFPIASSFVIWIIHLAGLAMLVKKLRPLLKDSRFLGAVFLLGLVIVAVSNNGLLGFSGDGSWYAPSEASQTPYGVPRG